MLYKTLTRTNCHKQEDTARSARGAHHSDLASSSLCSDSARVSIYLGHYFTIKPISKAAFPAPSTFINIADAFGPSPAVPLLTGTFHHDQHLLSRVSTHFALWSLMPFNSSDDHCLINAFDFVSFSNPGSWEQWHLLVNPVNWIFSSSKSQRLSSRCRFFQRLCCCSVCTRWVPSTHIYIYIWKLHSIMHSKLGAMQL